ncbi:uncharacterized protein LOC126791654 [Argentina anserina]|uniref:uncharacterized protein LOC126791654 n=1 Tax=Argentina anserina TaxID=57926 RepID=UPI002176462D|nr:uncharacterized protein LOC126791654 [Potentilla anserina]
MITSSSRKQRVCGAHKKNVQPVSTTTLSTNYDLLLNETAETCLGHDALSDDCKENKCCEEGTAECMLVENLPMELILLNTLKIEITISIKRWKYSTHPMMHTLVMLAERLVSPLFERRTTTVRTHNLQLI